MDWNKPQVKQYSFKPNWKRNEVRYAYQRIANQIVLRKHNG